MTRIIESKDGDHDCHLVCREYEWTEPHGERCWQRWWECAECGEKFTGEELDAMSNLAQYVNPFHTWTELAQGLRDRFVAELANVEQPPDTAYRSAVLGALADLIRRCEHTGVRLQDLEKHDREAYEAFLRAERSA